MRYKLGAISVGLISLCLVVQAYAAPAGFVEHKAQGFSISLPSAWKVLPQTELAKLQNKAAAGKLVLAATAAAAFPKITALEQVQGDLSQKEFDALSDADIEKMCKEFTGNLEQRRPDAKDVNCSRQKSEKGSALVLNMTIASAGVVNTAWTFYLGKKTVLVSGIFKATDAEQSEQVAAALKSIKIDEK